jgi:hypothetical protein
LIVFLLCFIPANNQGIQRVVVTNTNTGGCSKEPKTGESTLDTQCLNKFLDDHFRPIPPVPNNPLSEQIYDEHNKLVTEYFEVIASYLKFFF